jgi:hypothetical protein
MRHSLGKSTSVEPDSHVEHVLHIAVSIELVRDKFRRMFVALGPFGQSGEANQALSWAGV